MGTAGGKRPAPVLFAELTSNAGSTIDRGIDGGDIHRQVAIAPAIGVAFTEGMSTTEYMSLSH